MTATQKNVKRRRAGDERKKRAQEEAWAVRTSLHNVPLKGRKTIRRTDMELLTALFLGTKPALTGEGKLPVSQSYSARL